MGIKWKVCGMRNPENIAEVAQINPDFMGFIFYHKSPRLVNGQSLLAIKNLIAVQKVGVFVNEDVRNILTTVTNYNLNCVQLHGNESLETVKVISLLGIKIIKVFRITDRLPLDNMELFAPFVSYFMFETYTPNYGGSGKKFDWTLLAKYDHSTPFFLSGGIDLDNIDEIKSMKINGLLAIDVNSRFETEPGVKNIEKLKKLKTLLA
jgi:phosphoribosylanthranilate isomerase